MKSDETRGNMLGLLRSLHGGLKTPQGIIEDLKSCRNPKAPAYLDKLGKCRPTIDEGFDLTKRLLGIEQSHESDLIIFLSMYLSVQMEIWQISEEELDAG